MKVLVCHRDHGSRKLVERLAPLLPGITLLDSPPGEPVRPLEGILLKDIDALLAIGPVDRSVMEAGRFAFIQTVGTGYEHIDLAAAGELGIWVAHVPSAETGNAESVAELAILLMLALARQLPAAQQGLREKRWAQPVGRALLGKTACVVGLGSVGLAVAERLRAFGMKLTATRWNFDKGAPAYVHLYPENQLPQALSQADYAVLCLRASGQNTRLFGAAMLAAMKPGAVLINVARGSLIDENALVASIHAGHLLRGAGLDVFWDEPADPGHFLFHLPQVIATPHIAGVTDVSLAGTFQVVAENLQRYRKGETPLHLVTHPAHLRSAAVY
ncbi:MAG TPA: NAD(P)-dependent oxidoreductase [Candidatus Acidoferrales bacterium]|jgi:phosphoglycerate dehydrogenase-like enzyme|nr:NAD(P)-dependent oxidoreductase [Candidatus Acidoferrales bacterium]